MTAVGCELNSLLLPVPPAPSLDSSFLVKGGPSVSPWSQDPDCHYMLLSLLPSGSTSVSFFLPLQCWHSLGLDSGWRLQTGHSDSGPAFSNRSSPDQSGLATRHSELVPLLCPSSPRSLILGPGALHELCRHSSLTVASCPLCSA